MLRTSPSSIWVYSCQREGNRSSVPVIPSLNGMSETDASKDESASPHVVSPPSILSPSRPGTISHCTLGSIRGPGIQSQAIPEVPEIEENLPSSSNVEGTGEEHVSGDPLYLVLVPQVRQLLHRPLRQRTQSVQEEVLIGSLVPCPQLNLTCITSWILPRTQLDGPLSQSNPC